MKKYKIYLLILSLMVLSFDVAMIFILNAYSVKNTKIIYIISKCVSIIILISVVIMVFCKNDMPNYLLQYSIAIIFQFIPLTIRYISVVKNGEVISFVIFTVTTIVYFGTEFGLLLLNKKSLSAIEKLKGQEIKVNVNEN